MQCNRKIGKKCLRLERHWLILLPLKIVLGEQQPVVTFVAAGCIFEVPEFCAWRTSQFPNLALKLCLSVSPRALTRLPWLAVGACSDALDQACLDGIRDLTPAYCSLLLEFEHPEQVANQLGDLKEVIKSAKAWPAEEAPLHEIRVCYDGADIEEFARCVRLSVSNVIALHTAPIYSVFVIGFSPGFPYLGPLDPRLHAPAPQFPKDSSRGRFGGDRR